MADRAAASVWSRSSATTAMEAETRRSIFASAAAASRSDSPIPNAWASSLALSARTKSRRSRESAIAVVRWTDWARAGADGVNGIRVAQVSVTEPANLMARRLGRALTASRRNLGAVRCLDPPEVVS